MQEKNNIRNLFDDIAPGYDTFNHLTSLGIDRCWRRRAIRQVKGGDVLDVACGTGDFAIAIARKLRCRVTGVDISEGMLEQMRRKVAREGVPGVTAEEGDCAALRFADCKFDSVTVAFGVRNFEDRPKCLREILRVLKPGGRFVMLELGVPSGGLVRSLYKFYFTRIMPLVGRRISGNEAAYRYLPASVLAFPGPARWMQTMREAGFTAVRHRSLTFGICRMYIGEK